MQDFKNIHKSKRRKHGKRKKRREVNAFKAIIEAPPQKRRLRLVLPALALALASYPLLGLFGSSHSKPTASPQPPPAASAPAQESESQGQGATADHPSRRHRSSLPPARRFDRSLGAVGRPSGDPLIA